MWRENTEVRRGVKGKGRVREVRKLAGRDDGERGRSVRVEKQAGARFGARSGHKALKEARRAARGEKKDIRKKGKEGREQSIS